jgi:acylphosphatase
MYARDKAAGLGLNGWVRNRTDGSVESVAEGEEAAVDEYVQWCRRGPPHARVRGVDVEYSASLSEFRDFSITY